MGDGFLSTYAEHDEKYMHNKEFKSSISDWKKYKDWVITVCFYCGVHMIEAILAQKYDYHSINHINRHDHLQKLQSDLSNSDIQKQYLKLESLSHKARYSDICSINDRDVNLAQNYLDSIEEWYTSNRSTT